MSHEFEEHRATDQEEIPSELDLRVAPTLPPLAIAEVTSTSHPTLSGCVRCRISNPVGDDHEVWLPTLRGLAIRMGDRVVIATLANYAESIVTGVLDGFRAPVEPEQITRASLALLPDEHLTITDEHGAPLAQIATGANGPVVRLMSDDVEIETLGKLRFAAKTIELCATGGAVRVDATDDVVVKGETIHLN